MKIVEVLFPEFSHIYAENYNITYLSKCNSSVKVINTSYNEEPYFVNNKVDMIYIGAMPDDKIEKSIKKLSSYKSIIKKMIDDNVLFLVTGNALEIFSSYIIEDKNKVNGLGIFNYYIEKDMNKRHNSWFIGSFNDMKIVGCRNQFSKCFNIENEFINVDGGFGSDFESKNEGINYNNFYATYLHGPLLVMNPLFTKYILNKLGLETNLIFEEDIISAYKDRCDKLSSPDARFTMGDHG